MNNSQTSRDTPNVVTALGVVTPLSYKQGHANTFWNESTPCLATPGLANKKINNDKNSTKLEMIMAALNPNEKQELMTMLCHRCKNTKTANMTKLLDPPKIIEDEQPSTAAIKRNELFDKALSVNTIIKQLKKCCDLSKVSNLEYSNSNVAMFARSAIAKSVQILENVLYQLAGGGSKNMSLLLGKLMHNHIDTARSIMKQHDKSLQEWERAATGIAMWMEKHSHTRGKRAGDVQNAVDAVVSAVLYSHDNALNDPVTRRVMKKFCISPYLAKQALEHNKEIHSSSQKQFRFKERKTQSNSTLPFWRQWLRENIFHNDDYTRLESFNKSKRIPVMVEEIKAMCGGGWTVVGKTKEYFLPRSWCNGETIEEAYNLVCKSEEYHRIWEVSPDTELGIETFRKAICPSIRPHKDQSCVNQIKMTQEWYQKATKDGLKNAGVRSRIDACDCGGLCASNNDFVALLSLLQKSPIDFIHEMVCPPALENEMNYTVQGIVVTPKLLQLDCVNGKCSKAGCGVHRFFKEKFNCQALSQCDEVVTVTKWHDAPRNGKTKSGKQRTQKEPTVQQVEFKQLLLELEASAQICLRHLSQDEWSKLNRQITSNCFPKDSIHIMNDFSATPDLKATATLNCSESNHAVLECYVVQHSPEMVQVEDPESGKTRTIRICHTDHCCFIGETDGPGKKNDNVFHHACLDYLVNHYKQKMGLKIKTVYQWTDNCSSQYKCQYNFMETATFGEKHGGTFLEHNYAIKDEFKGPHDAVGKIVKDQWKAAERENHSIATGLDGYKYLVTTLQSEKKKLKDLSKMIEKRDPKLLSHGKFAASGYLYAYVTEVQSIYDELKTDKRWEHVIFLDRKHKSRRTTGRINGSSDFHSVRGLETIPSFSGEEQTNPSWKIQVAQGSCYCHQCRFKTGVQESCRYNERRNAKIIEVKDKSTLVATTSDSPVQLCSGENNEDLDDDDFFGNEIDSERLVNNAFDSSMIVKPDNLDSLASLKKMPMHSDDQLHQILQITESLASAIPTRFRLEQTLTVAQLEANIKIRHENARIEGIAKAELCTKLIGMLL